MAFSLAYDVQPDDIQELMTSAPRRRARRNRVLFDAVVMALIGVILTAVTVALDLPSVVKNSSGAPSWMYVVDAFIWLYVVLRSIRLWRTAPKRLTRRVWRNHPEFHGRHLDEVGPGGVRNVAPNGAQRIFPWTQVGSIRETENAFYLLDHHGRVLMSLPKRGLASPDLITPLRDYLSRSVVNGQPAPPTPASGAGELETLG